MRALYPLHAVACKCKYSFPIDIFAGWWCNRGSMTTKQKENQIIISCGASAASATTGVCLFFIWLSGIECGRNIPFAIAVAISSVLTLVGSACGVGIGLRIIENINSKEGKR